MAIFLKDVSHTFGEYLLVPGLTTPESTPDKIVLQTPLSRFKRGEAPRIRLNIPFVSAIMQSVSNDTLAIELARNGGFRLSTGRRRLRKRPIWYGVSKSSRPVL